MALIKKKTTYFVLVWSLILAIENKEGRVNLGSKTNEELSDACLARIYQWAAVYPKKDAHFQY